MTLKNPAQFDDECLNFMTLHIKATSCNESFARSAVAAFCVQLNPTMDQINDIKTAISEAVTNSIVHGYDGQGNGIITINACIKEDVLYIEIIDSGCGIEDIERARQPFYTTKPEQERSGMGFTVMESFMTNVKVANNTDGGIKVSMSKRIIQSDN